MITSLTDFNKTIKDIRFILVGCILETDERTQHYADLNTILDKFNMLVKNE